MSFLAAPPAPHPPPPPTAAPPATGRDGAEPAGAPAALLTRLHADVLPGVLPAGPGGHVLLPEQLVVRCDRFTTPGGPVRRGGPAEELVGHLRTGVGPERLVALRVTGAGPAPGPEGDAWAAGLVGVRLAVAEAALRRATDRLAHRSVAGTATLSLPMVRALVADAAATVAEARSLSALVAAPATPGSAAGAGLLRRAHRALDQCGRTTLHLLGAVGFLADGPGAALRASELLGDAYAPARNTSEAS
ncbi:hypothetical protein [Streptomyces spiramenti]|uniref:Acyl-CoA dehydrogenase/oxidase C-terminal domain-containing protein n=1 Tax=Streptomyces spiramenti TaxID=2720606 RepID=A0ABX1AS01_9ACTN|nr:hypothetical protein [Streptomyces spiramenti]NJP69115.1 hypothetical protein [Streptomyces spiramenti]